MTTGSLLAGADRHGGRARQHLGTVTDGAAPLAGIEVAVYDNTPYGDVLVDQVVTDVSGAYQLDGIPADPYHKVRFTDPTGEHATEYYRDQVSGSFATWVPVTAGDVNTMIDATLEPGSTLSGRLTRAGGAPVAGGTVPLWWRYGAQAYARVSDHVADARRPLVDPGCSWRSGVRPEFRDPVTGAAQAWDDRPIGSRPSPLRHEHPGSTSGRRSATWSDALAPAQIVSAAPPGRPSRFCCQGPRRRDPHPRYHAW